jgi:chromate transporter
LVLVSAWIIADASAQNSLLIAIIAIATAMSLFKKVHPLWVMLFGAVAGASFL